MKRPRYISVFIAVILLAVLGGRAAYTSSVQNLQVRAHFTQLFTALQHQDKKAVDALYDPIKLTPKEYETFFAYSLLGWKITDITGQPWPMDETRDFHTLTADLYYQIPTTGVPAVLKDKYQQITHPEYGPCLVVPVKLQFFYDATSTFGWCIKPPKDGAGWPCPYVEGDATAVAK